jgi:hypothetical protein
VRDEEAGSLFQLASEDEFLLIPTRESGSLDRDRMGPDVERSDHPPGKPLDLVDQENAEATDEGSPPLSTKDEVLPE